MEAKDALALVKQVIDETTTQLGGEPIIRISAQMAATKMFRLALEAGKQEGRREVVEWIKHGYWTGLGSYNIPLKDWQAYLKEWFG